MPVAMKRLMWGKLTNYGEDLLCRSFHVLRSSLPQANLCYYGILGLLDGLISKDT